MNDKKSMAIPREEISDFWNNLVMAQMSAPGNPALIRQYRKNRLVARAIVVSGFFGALAIAIYGGVRSDTVIMNFKMYFAVAVELGLIAFLVREFLGRSKCPVCAERFAARPDEARVHIFAARCANCGLSL